MSSHADKEQDSKNQSATKKFSLNQSHGGDVDNQFEDNRPEATQQKNLKEMVMSSPQVSQLKAFQDMVNESPQVREMNSFQEMVNNSPQAQHTTQLHAIASNASAPPVQKQTLEEEEEIQMKKAAGKGEVVQKFPVQVEARGAAHNIRGGTSMTAKVGAESEWVYGSKPPGGVPNLLTKIGSYIQGKQRYIAGHLLNDNMGGQGVNNNLTVLSSDGNKKHTGIEGKVKELAQKADQINAGSNNLGDPAYDHGARYSVQVLAPNPGANPPYSNQEKYIGAGLQISIDPIRIHKVTQAESPWPEEVGGKNDLTNYIVDNVPPYPKVPKKKGLTPVQKHIVRAITTLGDIQGSTLKNIYNFINANVAKPPTKRGVTLALQRGVSSRFFSKRAGRYKVIAKNIV